MVSMVDSREASLPGMKLSAVREISVRSGEPRKRRASGEVCRLA
jgi:hypothetical protein